MEPGPFECGAAGRYRIGRQRHLDPFAASGKGIRRPARDDPAAVDDRHVVAGLLDLGQEVARYKDRPAATGQGEEQVPDLDDARWVEAIDRFVEDEDRRVGDKGEGDTEPLAHPGRIALRRTPCGGRQIDQGERGGDARVGSGPGPTPCRGQDAQVLSAR